MEFKSNRVSLEESSENIVKDNKYADYIYELVKKYNRVFSDETPSNKENINDIKKMYYFFNAIHTYAEKNYFFPVHEDYQYSYNVKYKDLYFKIGINNIQGAYFFAENIELPDKTVNYINVEDVISKKNRSDMHVIQDAIVSLNRRIDTLVEDGIPADIIIKSLEDKVESLKKEIDAKQRKHKQN